MSGWQSRILRWEIGVADQRTRRFLNPRRPPLKALELDNNLGAAHAWLGKIAFFYEWDWPKAEKELRQALELDPNYVPAHLVYAVFLVSMGERERGLAEMNRARQLDPTSELTNVIATYVFYISHQFDPAIEQGERTVELYPGSTAPYIWLAASYEIKGRDQTSYCGLPGIIGPDSRSPCLYSRCL